MSIPLPLSSFQKRGENRSWTKKILLYRSQKKAIIREMFTFIFISLILTFRRRVTRPLDNNNEVPTLLFLSHSSLAYLGGKQ